MQQTARVGDAAVVYREMFQHVFGNVLVRVYSKRAQQFFVEVDVGQLDWTQKDQTAQIAALVDNRKQVALGTLVDSLKQVPCLCLLLRALLYLVGCLLFLLLQIDTKDDAPQIEPSTICHVLAAKVLTILFALTDNGLVSNEPLLRLRLRLCDHLVCFASYRSGGLVSA